MLSPQHYERTVLTYGTFDLFHIGHVRLLQRARSLGERLIVGLSTDEFNDLKGKRSVYPYRERKEILEACRFVDLVVPEENWEQKREDVSRYRVSLFVMGDDWTGKFDFLRDCCEVVYLDRTPEISTTLVKASIHARR